jgi:4-carboxymuconolactone decarboxylase
MTTASELRFPPIPEARWSDEQKRLVDKYRQSWRGPTVGLNGKPLGGLLEATFRSPELASRLADVIGFLRDKTDVPTKLRELAIVLVAHHWKCAFETAIHVGYALKAGVSQEVLDAIASDKRPKSMPEDEEIVYDVIMGFLTTHELSDKNFERARKKLGEKQLIELVAIGGYYTLVSMFFATAKVGAQVAP